MGLVIRVNQHMGLQMIFPQEALVTLRTVEVFVPLVDEFMMFEICAVAEVFAAMFTHVRFLPCVGSHVFSNVSHMLSTVWARPCLLSIRHIVGSVKPYYS